MVHSSCRASGQPAHACSQDSIIGFIFIIQTENSKGKELVLIYIVSLTWVYLTHGFYVNQICLFQQL